MSHIIVRADKGVWTLDDVLELLKKNGINYKLVDKTRVEKPTVKKLTPGKLEERRNN